MKLVSKTHDYYDSVLAHGRDEDLVFVRKNETIEVPKDTSLSTFASQQKLYNAFRTSVHLGFDFSLSSLYWKGRSNSCFTINTFCILFCGKEYPCLTFEFEEPNGYGGSTKGPAQFIYNEHDLHRVLKKHHKEIKQYNERYDANFEENTLPKIKQFLTSSGRENVAAAEYCYEHKLAYVMIVEKGGYGWWGNYHSRFIIEHHPNLKKLGFAQVVDPFTAFQEISMFLGNIPRDPNMMVTLTDKEELVKKGFDNMSFKKAPTKKR